MNTEESFTSFIRTARKTMAITQTNLAQRLTIAGFPFTQQMIAKLETGRRPVRLNEAVAITDALGVSLVSVLQDAGGELDDLECEVRTVRDEVIRELIANLEKQRVG